MVILSITPEIAAQAYHSALVRRNYNVSQRTSLQLNHQDSCGRRPVTQITAGQMSVPAVAYRQWLMQLMQVTFYWSPPWWFLTKSQIPIVATKHYVSAVNLKKHRRIILRSCLALDSSVNRGTTGPIPSEGLECILTPSHIPDRFRVDKAINHPCWRNLYTFRESVCGCGSGTD